MCVTWESHVFNRRLYFSYNVCICQYMPLIILIITIRPTIGLREPPLAGAFTSSSRCLGAPYGGPGPDSAADGPAPMGTAHRATWLPRWSGWLSVDPLDPLRSRRRGATRSSRCGGGVGGLGPPAPSHSAIAVDATARRGGGGGVILSPRSESLDRWSWPHTTPPCWIIPRDKTGARRMNLQIRRSMCLVAAGEPTGTCPLNFF